jgi:hypothetical protein
MSDDGETYPPLRKTPEFKRMMQYGDEFDEALRDLLKLPCAAADVPLHNKVVHAEHLTIKALQVLNPDLRVGNDGTVFEVEGIIEEYNSTCGHLGVHKSKWDVTDPLYHVLRNVEGKRVRVTVEVLE